MENIKNAINWFEIPVTDFGRAKKFYSTIYNYEMPDMEMPGKRMGFFIFEENSQRVGGAIVKADEYVPSKNGVRIYLNAGRDLNIVLNRVEEAGGKVLLPKTLITPETGYFANIEDTEGNVLALHSME